MRWFAGFVLVAWVSAASCDRRPEEPLLEGTQPVHASETAGGKGSKPGVSNPSSNPSSNPGSQSERCVVPLPSEPPPPSKPAASCPPDPVFGGVTLDKGKVSFPQAPGSPVLDVELARRPHERQRGLMYRRHMAENTGMLFDFPGPARVQSFWMRNTCIPLDMLFIAEDGFIAGVQENVPTLNDASRSIPCPVRYVLEVNAGWVREHGVKPGQFVELPE